MDPTSLQNLHDIIAPLPSPWLPPAPGWYALGLSLLLLLILFSVQKYLRWRQNKYRRDALAELDALTKELIDSNACQLALPRLPQLVKRTAMAAYGRSSVASLSDEDWLAFLDATASTHLFSQGSGRLLNACSYQSAAQLATFSREQVEGLQQAVSLWIRTHQNSLQQEEYR
jgi:hypothetical protein